MKDVQDRKPQLDLTVVEFFAGIGLMRMGLEQAGWRILWANDMDSEKERMYRGNFRNEDEHFASEDVHLLNANGIPSATLATASFP